MTPSRPGMSFARPPLMLAKAGLVCVATEIGRSAGRDPLPVLRRRPQACAGLRRQPDPRHGQRGDPPVMRMACSMSAVCRLTATTALLEWPIRTAPAVTGLAVIAAELVLIRASVVTSSNRLARMTGERAGGTSPALTTETPPNPWVVPKPRWANRASWMVRLPRPAVSRRGRKSASFGSRQPA